MGKSKVFSGKEICQILQARGFHEARRKGSHIIMQKTLSGSTITVVVPDHKEIRPGTLASIIRQSGVGKSAFE